MTVADLVNKARQILSDNRADMGYRAEDSELIDGLNEALQAMVGLVPGLFGDTVSHACAAGAYQVLDADRATALLDIPGLYESDLATLNQFAPGWTTATTAGAAREFLRLPGETLRFLVYPPAAGTEVLHLRIVRAPQVLDDLADVVPLPENYGPALVEYMVGRVELKDDEHVNTTRAAQLLERFAAGVKALAT